MIIIAFVKILYHGENKLIFNEMMRYTLYIALHIFLDRF